MGKQIPVNLLQATFLMSAIIQRIGRKKMEPKPEPEVKTEPQEKQKQQEEAKPQEGENGHGEQ